MLLDGIGPTGLRQGTHWLHDSAHTVELAFQQVLADVDHQLDHVWYLHRDGSWHLVFGAGLGVDPNGGTARTSPARGWA